MNNESGRFNRRKFLSCRAGLLATVPRALAQPGSILGGAQACEPLGGPFQPNWESLKAYRCPDWFRDAKFGIWAHWSPQCVPEQGDWYARGMYIQGSSQYDYHVKTYGHPSQFGYKTSATSGVRRSGIQRN
jgi:alpha-L-fucosidase